MAVFYRAPEQTLNTPQPMYWVPHSSKGEKSKALDLSGSWLINIISLFALTGQILKRWGFEFPPTIGLHRIPMKENLKLTSAPCRDMSQQSTRKRLLSLSPKSPTSGLKPFWKITCLIAFHYREILFFSRMSSSLLASINRHSCQSTWPRAGHTLASPAQIPLPKPFFKPIYPSSISLISPSVTCLI